MTCPNYNSLDVAAGSAARDLPKSTMAIEVKHIATSSERDACYLIRFEVFVQEQKVPPWEEMDEFDETAEHFAAECDGRIVGTARLADKGGGVGKIGRVAVLKEYRNQGVGKWLMQAIL